MNEGTGTAGGHLVPEHVARELYGFFEGASAVAPYLTTVDMTTDKKYLPLSDGKVSVTINEEEDSITETTPSLDRATLQTYRMDAYTKVSNELLEDSDLAIQDILLDQFNEQSAMLFDDVVANGDGSAGSAGFSGVFSATVGYSEVFDTGSTAFSEVTLAKMIDLAHLIPSYVRREGQVFMHSDVMKYLRKEMDDSGQYLMPPYTFTNQGMLRVRSGPPSVPKLLGAYPMLESHKCPSTSGADTAFIVFGNFKYIAHGLRHNATYTLSDPYTNAANWQTRLIYVRRFALAYLKTTAFARMVTGSST
jgi:HK97 family phage major capsid protein